MAERDGGILHDAQGRRVLKAVAADAPQAVTDVLMAGQLVDAEGRELVVLEGDVAAAARPTVIDLKLGAYASWTLAVQGALATVDAAGGGIVQGDPNELLPMTAELTLPDNVELRDVALSWAADLGAGKYAIKRPATPGIQYTAPKLTNVRLFGPGGSTVGVQGCDMDAIQLTSNMKLSGGYCEQFRAGLVITGDHEIVDNWQSGTNYYNVLYSNARATMGNQQFKGCAFQGALFAAIAVEGENIMDGVAMDNVDLGYSPYGIYKFDGTLTANDNVGLLNQSVLRNCSFEYVGNGAILDESTGAGSGADSLTGVRLINPGHTWNPTYRIAARNKDYAVRVRNVNNFVIEQPIYPFQAGDIATYYFGNALPTAGVTGADIDGGAIGASMFAAGSLPHGTRVRHGNLWTGMVCSASAAITVGQAVQLGQSYDAKPYGTDSDKAYLGIAMNTAASGGFVVVATEGTVQALCRVVSTGGHYLTPDSAGPTVLKATAVGVANPHPIVAVSLLNGGSAGGAMLHVRLIPPSFDRAGA